MGVVLTHLDRQERAIAAKDRADDVAEAVVKPAKRIDDGEAVIAISIFSAAIVAAIARSAVFPAVLLAVMLRRLLAVLPAVLLAVMLRGLLAIFPAVLLARVDRRLFAVFPAMLLTEIDGLFANITIVL